jgi:hypothetical protein
MKKWALWLILPVVAAGIATLFVVLRHTPQYCWLIFGPEARLHVLVRLDEEAVALVYYANGKPTGRREQFRSRSECMNIALSDPDGKTSYFISKIRVTAVAAGEPAQLFAEVEIKGSVNYYQYCSVDKTTADPLTAPVVHFHGPLCVQVQKVDGQVRPGLALIRGNDPTEIFATVGTMDAQKGCSVLVRAQDTADKQMFPAGIHPFVEVDYPAKNEADSPIRRRYALDRAC